MLDIGAGSDGQIVTLEGRATNKNHIVRVFTKDGHQQHIFRVNSQEDCSSSDCVDNVQKLMLKFINTVRTEKCSHKLQSQIVTR